MLRHHAAGGKDSTSLLQRLLQARQTDTQCHTQRQTTLLQVAANNYNNSILTSVSFIPLFFFLLLALCRRQVRPFLPGRQRSALSCPSLA